MASGQSGGYAMATQDVRELQHALTREAAGIRGEIERLDECVARLRDEWSGDAASAYDRAQVSWNAKMKEMDRLLRQAGLVAGDTVDQHLDVRRRVANLWT